MKLMSQRIWRFVHNVVAHPLMEILPDRLGTWLHDETGSRAFGRLPIEGSAKSMMKGV